MPTNTEFSDQQISKLERMRVFFGHQSVGANIVQGVNERITQDPRLHLVVVHSDNPRSTAGPAILETQIGRNGYPQSKDTAFSQMLDRAESDERAIALYKYCFVDFTPSTDVPALFAQYKATIEAAQQRHASLKFALVTVPLTTSESGLKAWLKSVVGRTSANDLNLKRNHFNQMLRQNFEGRYPIFDLAALESTYGDGSRAYVTHAGEKVFALAPEFSSDGAHLNAAGRAYVADRFLSFLAGL